MRKLSEIIRLAVRESFDFGLTVNHPPTARSPNAAKAVSDCTDAGRNRGGIVLRQTIGASGSWSSAQALGAGKPRSRAPRPPVTFARSNSRQSGTWQLAREKSGSSCYRSRLILTSGELIPDQLPGPEISARVALPIQSLICGRFLSSIPVPSFLARGMPW